MRFDLWPGEVVWAQWGVIVIIDMSSYEELMGKIRSGHSDLQVEAFKKLVYLAVNDEATFKRYAMRILAELTAVITDLEEQEPKILCLQLLSEIAGSYKQFVPKTGFKFSGIVPCLSDEKVQIRKSSHYMILTFVKKYEELDPILQSYDQIGRSATCPWKLAQKIIHSFESLIVVEPKCVKYSKDFANVDHFLDFVLEKDVCDNVLVKKASNQALTSFVKNQYVPDIIPSLNKNITNRLLEHSKSINYFPFCEKVAQKRTTLQEDVEDDHIEEINITFTPSTIPSTQHIPSFKSNIVNSPESPTKKMSSSIERKREKLIVPDLSPPQEIKEDDLLESLIQRIQSSQPWNVKCQAIGQIHTYLTSNKVTRFPDVLIQRVLELTSDLNFKTCITSLNTISYVVSESFRELRIHQEKLEDILSDKICEMKVAIRKIAGRIIKEMVTRHNQHRVIRILMQRVKTCSFSGKQEILELVQDIYTTTVQDDYGFVVAEIASLLFQDNTTIKAKAMSCIVAVSESSNLQQCKGILSKKLDKVYYHMFTEKLKDKTIPLTKPHGIQVENTSTPVVRSQEVDHAMTYTDMRPNPASRLGINQGKDVANTISNFGSFPSSSPDHKLGIIGRKQKISQFQREDEKQKQKDKAYQYKPQLSRKLNGKSEIMEATEVGKREESFVSQSEQVKGKKSFEEGRKGSSQQQPEEQQKMEEEKQQTRISSKPFGTKKTNNLMIEKNEEREENSPIGTNTRNSLLKKTLSGTKQHRIPEYKTTTYMNKDEIQPLPKPEGALKRLAVDIKKDDDWSLQFQSLNSIRKILKYHKNEYLGLVQNLPQVMPEVIKLVDSLRSGLAKNAMITLCQLCESLKKEMDPFLEMIFIKLFKKGCDANSFICEEAKKCINHLCFYCTSQKVIPIIMGTCQSKQAQVRQLIATMIQKITTRANTQSINFLKENIKLVNILGQYLVDSNNEVRSIAKALILSLARNYSRNDVEVLFRKNVSEEALNRLKGLLDKELNEGMVVRSISRKDVDLD